MKLSEIVEKLQLDVKSGNDLLDRDVTGGYVSDMLSDVIAHSEKGNIWITLQTHLNIIPVASMKEISGIIIVNGRQPDQDALKKAEEEKVPVLGTDMKAFQVVGRLYQLGIGGKDEDV
jgi:predicted transcriptional regulator